MLSSKFGLPIFHKTYRFVKLIDQYQEQIPKKKKYTLWKKCDDLSLELLQKVMRASDEREAYKRKQRLYDLNFVLDQLRIFFRLCFETQCFSEKKYLVLVTHLDEMGKMIGGWIRSLER